MNKPKQCHFCQGQEVKKAGLVKDWIVEHHYLGSHGQILKECLAGGAKNEEQRKPIKIIFYCSINCMERQIDKEEEELWAKGNCLTCQKPLAIINDECSDLEHKKEGCLFSLNNKD